MAATHSPTRRTKRPTQTRHPRRLPRLGWGGAILTLFSLYIAARTWPVQAIALGVLIAAVAVLAAIRPRRLSSLWHALDRITTRRRALPRGHARTRAAFQRMSPAQFEQAIAELAREHHSVHTATAVGQANDRGADVLVHLNDGRRILIQCKKYRDGNNVGSETIQTINGVYRDIHHCHEAAIVTTASFTRAAIDTNTMLPAPIRLIDGDALVQWANGGLPPWR